MSIDVTAALVRELDGPFVMVPLQLEDPGPGEALIRLVATGVCHTDGLARHGDLPFPLPGVLGHEGAGVVDRLGPGVTEVEVGDHVVIGWPSCGTCRNCRAGEPRYCGHLGELLGGGGRPGGGPVLREPGGGSVSSHFFGQSSFATYSLAQAAALVPVPTELPLELLGPLACGVSTGAGAVFHTARPEPGSSLVVFGVGTVGLSAVMAAVNTPATRIVVVDRHPARLALARELGATHAVDAGVEDAVARIAEICKGPADYALECTGVVSVVRQAVDVVGMLGTCILIGGAPVGAEMTLDHLTTLWGKRVVGVLGGSGRSRELMTALIELHLQGRFPFDRLVRYFDLADVEKAMAASESGEVVKPILRMPSP